MSEAEINDRLEKAERKLRGIEELAFSFGDILNLRSERYDAEVVEIRKRLEHLDRAVSMLQLDVRDIRSGVTLQLTGQDRRIADLSRQMQELKAKLEVLEAKVDHQGEIQLQHGAILAQHSVILEQHSAILGQHSGQLGSINAKLDTILARLGA